MNRSVSAPVGISNAKAEFSGPTIKGFVQEIKQLPPEQKMAQIGIERKVLGLPNENSQFDGKSFFSDNAFLILKNNKTPKIWLDFIGLQPPANIIQKMPPETLFFMFYAQPHDRIQVAAANQLKARGWEYSPKGSVWSLQKREGIFKFDVQDWVIKEVSKY